MRGSTLRRRLPATLVAILLLATGLTVVLPAQEADAAVTRCVWDGGSYRTCATVQRKLGNKRHIKYRTSVTNSLPRNVTGNCVMRKEQRWAFGVNFSATAKMKAAIFASMEATFGGNLEYSFSTSYETSVGFTVAPRETVFCDWGVVATYSSGTITQEWWGPYKRTSRTWSGQAMNYDNWHIYR